MSELRKAVPAIRVSNVASAAVRVQFLGKGLPVYPEFAVPPGGSHITIQPAGLEQVQYWSKKPRIARFMTFESGFWLDGEFHLLLPTKPEAPAVSQ